MQSQHAQPEKEKNFGCIEYVAADSIKKLDKTFKITEIIGQSDKEMELKMLSHN